MNDLTFFLGANTYQGFYSLYEEYLLTRQDSKVWILKGGAGCGKSGFMRTVADRVSAEGYTAHRILCSGDPASLDGVHIPDMGVILLDGTAPHVLEPALVGEKGFYLDLSRYYRPGVPELREQDTAYKEHYRIAYRWLAAAGETSAALALPPGTEEIIRRKASALITRELRVKSKTPGRITRVFLDAFTGNGMLSLADTKEKLAEHRIGLHGVCGIEHAFLSAAADAALSRGWDVVLALSPLQPGSIAQLFIPERGFGIGVGEGERYIHLDKIIYQQTGRDESATIRDTESMRNALLTRAKKELALARYHHDRLEEAVNPYVDFTEVYKAANSFADRLLLETAAGEASV